jgi:HEAT repeat protein
MGLFTWLSGKKAGRAEAEAPRETAAEDPARDLEASDLENGAQPDGEHVAQLSRAQIELLANALDSKDGGARVDASAALIDGWREGSADAAEAIAPRLHELLDDEEPLVRRSALAGAQMLRKPENIERCASGVLALLADPVPQIRVAAAWAAARLPGETARQQVRSLLESEDETLRFAAACALSDAQDPAALPELISALHEEHRRQEALSALMALGDASALQPLAEVFEQESLGQFDRTLAAAALARFGDARGSSYLAERVAEDGDDRPIAAEWAGRLRVTEAVPALEDLASLEGEPARGAALRALGRLKASGAEDLLAGIAGDEEAAPDLRMDAAEGLAELGALGRLEALAQGDGELAQLCRELLVEARRSSEGGA